METLGVGVVGWWWWWVVERFWPTLPSMATRFSLPSTCHPGQGVAGLNSSVSSARSQVRLH